MKNYILIFKTSISTAVVRSDVLGKLYKNCEKIKLATIDIDDEENVLRIETSCHDYSAIYNVLQREDHLVHLLAIFEQNADRPLVVSEH